jgi:Rab-like protein 5
MAADGNGLKILVLGPKEAGKTVLANVLAENTDAATDTYRPTVGVRVLEFDAEKTSGAHIELWDVSGDDKYSGCWPAIQQKCVGIILVYNPETAQQVAEVEAWYQNFSQAMNLPPKQCMVIQTLRDGNRKYEGNKLPPSLQQLAPPVVVASDDLSSVRPEFERFVNRVNQSVADVQRSEEDDIAGGL